MNFLKSKLHWTCFLLENENQVYNNWKMGTFNEKETFQNGMLTLGKSSYLPSSAITAWLWPDIAPVGNNNYKNFIHNEAECESGLNHNLLNDICLISVKFLGNATCYQMIATLYSCILIWYKIIYTFICDRKLCNRMTNCTCECHGNYKWIKNFV